ncbi:MAG: YbbR-like domain-containing protein [Limnochordia bacterium]|jgi:YbbR domain-containing protein
MKWQLPPDMGMRTLALVIAVALWFVAASDDNTRSTNLEERVVNARVSLKGVGEGLVALTDPGFAQVRIRIPSGADVPDELNATLDMTNLPAGEHNIRVDVAVPAKYGVVQINPERITVRLENEIAREYAVELALIGFPPGESVSVLTPEPATVRLIGGESRINAVRRVLAMIQYSPALSDQSVPVMLRPIDVEGTEITGVTVIPNQVKVIFSFGAVDTAVNETDTADAESEAHDVELP